MLVGVPLGVGGGVVVGVGKGVTVDVGVGSGVVVGVGVGVPPALNWMSSTACSSMPFGATPV